MLKRTAALAGGLCLAGLLAAGSAAADTPQRCAPTTDQPNGAPLVAGQPCWVDVTPYPFGADGTAVTDPVGQGCYDPQRASPFYTRHGPSWVGDFERPCYLQVTAMAFRAWNRGLALTSGGAYRVWLYNGRDWFPDPTFPGGGTCPGNRIFWAGKRDFWLVGGTGKLCRFDGVNLEWEPLPVPKAALAELPPPPGTPPGTLGTAVVNDGGCFSWDNCWFVGDNGLQLHWDGQALSGASSDVAPAPWGRSFLKAFQVRQTPAGAVGLAVGTSGTSTQPSAVSPSTESARALGGSRPLPAQPDGSPPPQVLVSRGGALRPAPYTPPTTPQPGDPFRTDLHALTVDGQGAAWAIGLPAQREGDPSGNPTATLLRIGPGGTPAPCPGYDGASSRPDPVLYDATSGVATLAAGAEPDSVLLDETIATQASSTGAQGTAFYRVTNPRLALVRCGDDGADPAHAPRTWSFSMPNPFVADDQNPPPSAVPGAQGAAAVNAGNDAWASAAAGQAYIADPNQSFGYRSASVRPHLYRFTDGQPPNAPAGDDYEPRPQVFVPEQPFYFVVPPAPAVTQVVPQTVTKPGKAKIIKKHGKPAIDEVRVGRARKAARGFYTLTFTFRVNAPVTIGIEGFDRRGRIVTSTGLKHFGRGRGRLVLRLDPKHLPRKGGVVFYPLPKKTAKRSSTLAALALALDLLPISALS